MQNNRHFTHLHLHTEYSLLDGAISLDKLVAFGKEQNFKSLAITDHGNVFGAVKFFQKCKKAGIKPILGMEAYFTEDATIKNADNKYYHLVILVQNQEGYRNLCKLIAYSYREGFYFKPRIDYKMLEKHSAGLIVTSACLGAHIPKLLLAGQQEKAEEKIDWFLNVFGNERFFLEVQPEDQKVQQELNQKLYALSKSKGVNLVATGDCHYASPDDHEAHEIMLCIQTHNKFDDPNRYTFGECRVPMRTTDEMLTIFSDHQDAVWNTGRIADTCDFDFTTDKLFFPTFKIPDTYSPESYFKHLCTIGLERLKESGIIPAKDFTTYDERLTTEVDLIISMGFVGYFLIVSDFIQWAYRNNIPVGPGRGSAAGSLVAWALQITNVDPIRYNLLFERFLNPERISMPDIDIDFCIEGREKVIQYVCDTYGHGNVCHIITFGTMMAKGVVKDVARVLGLPFEDSNMITSLIPDQLGITLKEAIEQEERLRELIQTNPKVKKIIDISFKLEGLTRHASKHAAGIVISPEPVDEVLPLYVPSKSTELVSQYAMSELESIGFLKIDFLGLKTLTLIDRTVKSVKKNYGTTLNMYTVALDDEKTFNLICEGKTSGVFQLESDGLKDVLVKLQPEKFEDIIAVNALYRPGPLGSGMVDDFIERRHGRQKISYIFDELAPILQETYGVIVYQEQVIKIASAIGGYSLGEADILRRAMGKKKADVMQDQEELFVSRASKKGFNKKKAKELFDLMAYFAGYGFNKSHSTAYAIIAYQTAYLKAHYTADFMACLISLETTNADKMAFYLHEAKSMGLELIPPNINQSEIAFTVVDGKLLFGLQGIKNVGLAALENIFEERHKKGAFTDLYDFCKRVNLRANNKRVIENLICSGAFDNLPGRRSQQFSEISNIIEKALTYKRDSATGQMGLFAVASGKTQDQPAYTFQELPEWDDKEKLEREKTVMGFYLIAHPLDGYQQQMRRLNIRSFSDIMENIQQETIQAEHTVIGCGLLTSRKDIITKKGDRMAFVHLEDQQTTAEIIVFPSLFAKVESWLDTYQVFVVQGVVDITGSQKCKIKANQLVPIEHVFSDWKQIPLIRLTMPSKITDTDIEKLHSYMVDGKSTLELFFIENGKQLKIRTKKRIKIDTELAETFENMDIQVRCFL